MMKLSNKFQNSNYNLKTTKNKRESIQESFDVFGKELRSLVEVRQLPELICMLGYMIKNYGVLSQGLFRISGNKTRMDELRSIYSHSKRLEVGIDDIHNITGLFKSFLREVPGGVIPCPQSLDLIKAARIYKRNENLDLLTNELLKLPVPNYNLLKFTCSLLYQVSRFSASNLMTPDNLGTVFGPTFFASVEDISLLPIANSASTILIQNYNDLFKVSAPVHTNLNQSTENNTQRCDDVNGDFANGYVTKSFADHITTIKFGDSCLLFSSNGETDNSLFSYSIQDEEPLPFPETVDSFNPNQSYPSHTQFSNSLDMALRMCLTNHLFNQFQDNDLVETESIRTPRLISDEMLNPPVNSGSEIKQSSSNSQGRNIGKKKTVEESPSLSSLPRREISSNILQNYLSNHNTDQRSTEIIVKSDSSQTTSDIVMSNELKMEKPSHPVPQLDLSILYDTPGPEKVRSPKGSKNQDAIKYKNINTYDNTRDTNIEQKIPDADMTLNQIKKSITNLKRQLRKFDDDYYSLNGVKPDKSVRANNEWYSKTIVELKLLRQEKEQFTSGMDKTEEYESAESGRNVKKKVPGASGDVTDYKPNFVMSPDNRSVMSRPVSAMSEIAARMTPSNESGRSNTLNSMATVTNQTPDLSQAELDSLKIALEKISNHLIAERIRDNRPSDLDSMTQQQIETEKVSMQKALLNFESNYGRKKTPNAVYLMRPLYDRYRQVKKRLCQMGETQDLEWKIAQRTLNSQPKAEVCPSAWTSDRPLSSGLQSLNRGVVAQANSRAIYIPTQSQFDIGEDYQTNIPQRPESSNDNYKSVGNAGQSQRRNVRTIQYRRSSAQTFSDSNNNNNKRAAMVQKDEWRAELQQLLVEKKDLQRILKDFENNFERDTRRKVEKLDRLPMEREYNRYKYIKNRIKELEECMDSPVS